MIIMYAFRGVYKRHMKGNRWIVNAQRAAQNSKWLFLFSLFFAKLHSKIIWANVVCAVWLFFFSGCCSSFFRLAFAQYIVKSMIFFTFTNWLVRWHYLLCFLLHMHTMWLVECAFVVFDHKKQHLTRNAAWPRCYISAEISPYNRPEKSICPMKQSNKPRKSCNLNNILRFTCT